MKKRNLFFGLALFFAVATITTAALAGGKEEMPPPCTTSTSMSIRMTDGGVYDVTSYDDCWGDNINFNTNPFCDALPSTINDPSYKWVINNTTYYTVGPSWTGDCLPFDCGSNDVKLYARTSSTQWTLYATGTAELTNCDVE